MLRSMQSQSCSIWAVEVGNSEQLVSDINNFCSNGLPRRVPIPSPCICAETEAI